MPELDKTQMGGTMRLGLRDTLFQEGSEWSKIRALYQDTNASAVIPNGPMDSPVMNDISSTDSTANGAAVHVPPPPSQPPPLIISERHRHRYEVNPAYVERLTEAGEALKP